MLCLSRNKMGVLMITKHRKKCIGCGYDLNKMSKKWTHDCCKKCFKIKNKNLLNKNKIILRKSDTPCK